MAATRLIALHINKGKNGGTVSGRPIQIILRMQQRRMMESISVLMNVIENS